MTTIRGDVLFVVLHRLCGPSNRWVPEAEVRREWYREMARRLGLSLRTVVNIERGTAGLAPRTVRAWLALRGTPAADTQPADVTAHTEQENS